MTAAARSLAIALQLVVDAYDAVFELVQELACRGRRRHLGQALDHGPARDVAAAVAAHAIGHRPQPDLGSID